MIETPLKRLSELTQYSILGGASFAFSIGMLYVLYDLLDMYYSVAVVLSIAAGAALHYFSARWLIFSESSRSVPQGLAYFVAITAFDGLVILIGVALLHEFSHIDVYWARVGMGLVAGLVNFFLNARYNFKAL